MPLGIDGYNNVTLKNITDVSNFTGDPAQFFIKANHIMFSGWFYFIMLLVLGVILFVIAQQKKDQPLNNAMYVSAALTILSFFLRVMQMTENGVVMSLLSDFQMWIFPLVSIILAGIVWFTK